MVCCISCDRVAWVCALALVVTLMLNQKKYFDQNRFIAQHFKHLPKNMPDGQTANLIHGCMYSSSCLLSLALLTFHSYTLTAIMCRPTKVRVH